MANEIQRMLEINSRLESASKGGGSVRKAATKQDLDSIIEGFDRQVYGDSDPVMVNEEERHYSAEEEMEQLREISKNGGRVPKNIDNTNIPRNILESIINNPLDVQPFEDSKMTMLEKKLTGKMPGIQASVALNEKLEKADKEAAKAKIVEVKQPTSVSVDYEMIKMLIENALDKKIGDLKNTLLTENRQAQQPYIPSLKYMNFKDRFLFVDNEDNVFECEMKYKGKRKKKQ